MAGSPSSHRLGSEGDWLRTPRRSIGEETSPHLARHGGTLLAIVVCEPPRTKDPNADRLSPYGQGERPASVPSVHLGRLVGSLSGRRALNRHGVPVFFVFSRRPEAEQQVRESPVQLGAAWPSEALVLIFSLTEVKDVKLSELFDDLGCDTRVFASNATKSQPALA